MKILISNPSIISVAGNSAKETIQNLSKTKSTLKAINSYSNQNFMLGEIKHLKNLPKEIDCRFQTRTNTILYNALLPLDNLIRQIIKLTHSNIAVTIGTTTTGVEENFIALKNNKHNYDEAKSALGNPALFVREFYNLNSFSFGISSACTSGIKAIIEASRLIKSNLCEAVICGGVDSLNTLTINGFASLGILSKQQSIPFSTHREGTNIAEGSAVFVLCNENIASKLDNQFLLEIKGYANNNDAFHITKSRQDCSVSENLILNTLKMAGLESKEIDYINLHGTGTQANDAMEAQIFSKYFKNTKLSSTKPLTGHTLGAAGAIEVAICSQLILESLDETPTSLPIHFYDDNYDTNLPQINLSKKGECAIVRNALSTSFAFGGDNSAIIIGRA